MRINERVHQKVNPANQGHITRVKTDGSFAVTYDGHIGRDLRGRIRKISGGTYWYRPAQAATFVKGNPKENPQ